MRSARCHSAARLGWSLALFVAAGCGDDTSVSSDESTSTGEDPLPSTSGGPVAPETSFDSGDDLDSGDSVGVEAFCGDAIVALGEQCDGDNLGGKTCADFGWPDGPNGLRCSDDCELDLESCVLCGNGIVDQDTEECDGDDTVDANCADIPGLLGGAVSCGDDCRLDYSECESSCGNGVIDPGEDCEEEGFFLCDEVFGPGWSGQLICSGCKYFVFECSECGDGVVGGFEDCDGSNKGAGGFEWTCEALFGFPTEGEVVCTDQCFIDGSGCDTCGNNFAEAGELCDGFDVNGLTCADVGFIGGVLGCEPDCMDFDVSGCDTCGDGVLDPGELCDGMELGTGTCEDQGFVGGTLGCLSDCTYDIANCGSCGDGIAVASEACDGDDLAGATCVDAFPGAQGGTLTCDASCEFDPAQCLFIGEADVVISEILYAAEADPDSPLGQWVELYNPNPIQAWDLGGCELDSNLPFETFTIASLVIPPNGYVTLGTGDAGDLFFAADASLGPSYSLGNAGDVVRLRCGSTLVDEVTYGNMAPWPAVQPGSAIATSVLDAAGNDDGSNWCAATTVLAGLTYGTPGMANDCI